MLKQKLSFAPPTADPAPVSIPAVDRIERLSAGEQVLTDIYRSIGGPGGFTAVDVDMSAAQTLIDQLRAEGLYATYTHLIVRAAGLAVAQHPQINMLGAGKWRVHARHVNLSLAVATGRFHPAMMLIEQVEQKTVREIATEIIYRTPIVRAQADAELHRFYQIGRWIPLSAVRQRMIKYVQNRLAFRQANGILSISSVPQIDFFVPFTVISTGTMGIGRVRECMTIRDGQSVIRPMATITCCFDHKVWHGGDPAVLLTSVRTLLETPGALN